MRLIRNLLRGLRPHYYELSWLEDGHESSKLNVSFYQALDSDGAVRRLRKEKPNARVERIVRIR